MLLTHNGAQPILASAGNDFLSIYKEVPPCPNVSSTRFSLFSTQHYIYVTVIALALLLHLPVVSWASRRGDRVARRPGRRRAMISAGDDCYRLRRHGAGWRYTGRRCLATPRFVDNGDGTVTDSLTGLEWTKNANRRRGLGRMRWTM